MTSLKPDEYTVGWIAALSNELAAAKALLDECHERPESWTQPTTDQNKYSWGRIQKHNIVLACLPKGAYGTTNAATVATTMLSTFASIRIGLMVGIGAGLPTHERGIRLGDVVISQPGDDNGGVVQYDRGKATSDGTFRRTGVLNKPPMVLLTALSGLHAKQMMGDLQIDNMIAGIPDGMKARWNFRYQGAHDDPLLRATNEPHGASGHPGQYNRSRHPVLWFGTIASGNTVVKSAKRKVEIVELAGKDTMCIEMEAAGLMDSFPCLVIRGICDYADADKNDKWQNYAALTAAAAAKELLRDMDAGQVQSISKAYDTIKQASHAPSTSYNDDLRQRLDRLENELTELRRRVKDLEGVEEISSGSYES